MFALRRASERDDGLVFDDEPCRRRVAVCDPLVQVALNRQRLAVREPAEIPEPGVLAYANDPPALELGTNRGRTGLNS